VTTVDTAGTASIQVLRTDRRDPAAERAYDALAERLIPVATELVARVREEGRESIGDLLGSLSALERHALPVVLAAMVPPDQGVVDLLRWVPRPNTPESTAPRPARAATPGAQPLRPCGTHAAFVRHKANGEPVDEDCALAERLYQRERKRTARNQPNTATAGQRPGSALKARS
jgi:hypothetical protein